MNIDAPYGLYNLGNLRLDRCLLRRIPYIADVKYTIHTLMVTRNLITQIPDDYFDDFPKLAMLNLANNQLAHFPDVSSVRRTLRILSLQSNVMAQIPKFMITTAFVVLEYLTVSDNEIDIIPSGFFRNCPNLQQFVITKNRLCALNRSLYEGRDKSAVLGLSGNPWWCDSALAWLCDLHLMDHRIQDVVMKYESYCRVGICDYGQLVCTGPRSHAGLDIKYLRTSSMTSINEMLPHETHILIKSNFPSKCPRRVHVVSMSCDSLIF